VAADTEEIAREAVDLIKVKYERLPAVFDPREALKPDAPILHEHGQGKWCKGNQVLLTAMSRSSCRTATWRRAS